MLIPEALVLTEDNSIPPWLSSYLFGPDTASREGKMIKGDLDP